MAKKRISFEGLGRLPFEEWELDEIPVQRNVYSHVEVPQEKKSEEPIDQRLYYISFGSGSSGNSSYVGTNRGGVIIDAGIKADEIEVKIKDNGLDIKKIYGVLLTHDHSDHVKYVYTLVKNNRHMKIYCTNRVMNGILRRHGISKRIKDYHIPIFKEIPFKIADLEITAFEVPHDGSDNMGFSLSFGERNFVLATDMGNVYDRARHYISKADHLVIESNYDLRMLTNGNYPEFLKARIQTDIGHMDNEKTAEFLKEIYTPRLKHIFLCHLSKDNNTPEKALETVREKLKELGIKIGSAMETLEDRKADVQLMALPRYESTRLFVFRPQEGEKPQG
ncbi:MAG: MBL fold metallo-hydrolase [Muribaculaceae bacterium]|nr:MBL fold metallo-hydrolase [Muribaculaceae bacterium]